jgi:hypothetical protein
MRWERLLVDTLVLFVLGLTLGGVGLAAGVPLGLEAARGLGLTQLAFESENAPLLASAWMGLAFAAPPFCAWLLDLLHRMLAKEPPSPRALGLWLGLLVLAVPLGIAWQYAWMSSGLESVPRDGSLIALFTMSSLDLDGAAMRMVVRFALVVGIVVFVRARRRRAASTE